MQLIIFAGLPGTGKSTLAEALGKMLKVPVFAKDWLEATLLRNGLAPSDPERSLGFVGYDLLTMLAERQLRLGQSVILDSVASTQTLRDQWRAMTLQYGAQWKVIECVCSDEGVHRARLIQRQRQIPGWHELTWADVEHVRSYYAAWAEPHLTLDMIDDFATNLAHARGYCE